MASHENSNETNCAIGIERISEGTRSWPKHTQIHRRDIHIVCMLEALAFHGTHANNP